MISFDVGLRRLDCVEEEAVISLKANHRDVDLFEKKFNLTANPPTTL